MKLIKTFKTYCCQKPAKQKGKHYYCIRCKKKVDVQLIMQVMALFYTDHKN